MPTVYCVVPRIGRLHHIRDSLAIVIARSDRFAEEQVAVPQGDISCVESPSAPEMVVSAALGSAPITRTAVA